MCPAISPALKGHRHYSELRYLGFSVPAYPLDSVPSNFTGTKPGHRHYPTGTKKGPLLVSYTLRPKLPASPSASPSPLLPPAASCDGKPLGGSESVAAFVGASAVAFSSAAADDADANAPPLPAASSARPRASSPPPVAARGTPPPPRRLVVLAEEDLRRCGGRE